MANVALADDEVLYVFMSLAVIHNNVAQNRKQRKAVAKKMRQFAFRYLKQAKIASKRFKSMTDEERSTFFQNFVVSEKLEKELKI